MKRRIQYMTPGKLREKSEKALRLELADDLLTGSKCPQCGADDYHLDPADAETNYWICESCGYMAE